MKVNENSYVSIQAFMVNELRLSGNELIIFAVIFGFSQDGETWFSGSRAYLAAWCQASKATVSSNLAKLCDKGYIEKRTRNENGDTFNDYRVCKKLDGVCKKLDGGVQETSTPPLQETCPHTIGNRESSRNDRKKIEVRHKHGEYQNVLLTDADLSKLQSEFAEDWQERIERLSAYMASTGKSYKNHLATIRNWARRDKQGSGYGSKPKEQKYVPSDDTEWDF